MKVVPGRILSPALEFYKKHEQKVEMLKISQIFVILNSKFVISFPDSSFAYSHICQKKQAIWKNSPRFLRSSCAFLALAS
jgi:hypothetical protein